MDEDELFTVSFLKRQSDGSYTWPLIEDKSSVELQELVIVKNPTEDMCCSRARISVKLIFDKNRYWTGQKNFEHSNFEHSLIEVLRRAQPYGVIKVLIVTEWINSFEIVKLGFGGIILTQPLLQQMKLLNSLHNL